MRRYAFTLIELLVVIAIILILAAILFPVFGRVREKARQTTCLSNQRQIAMAITMDVQDNKEYFPGTLGLLDEKLWRNELGSETDKLFNCPSTQRNGTADDPEVGINFYLCGVAYGDVKEPSKVVLSADSVSNQLQSAADVDMKRHNKGYVCSFVDGHTMFYPEASNSVIFGNGEEGTLLSFGVLNETITYSDDATATGTDSAVDEGGAVLLVNGKDADLTAKVTVTGGTTPSADGLNPATADLTIHKGMKKAFALYCFTDAGGAKVDTTYTFGDAATGKVEVVCRKPVDPAAPQP